MIINQTIIFKKETKIQPHTHTPTHPYLNIPNEHYLKPGLTVFSTLTAVG